MAPWGPVMALLELGCRSWTFFDGLRDDDFASQRGGFDKREHVRLGRLRSSSPPLASLWKSGFRPPLLIALALISSRLSIWCSSPSSPVAIASWTFAYHIGLGSTRPLRSLNDYSGHGSQLPFVRTPLNDLLLADRLSTIRTPVGSSSLLCLNFTGTWCCLHQQGPIHQRLPCLGSATWGSSPLCESVRFFTGSSPCGRPFLASSYGCPRLSSPLLLRERCRYNGFASGGVIVAY